MKKFWTLNKCMELKVKLHAVKVENGEAKAMEDKVLTFSPYEIVSKMEDESNESLALAVILLKEEVKKQCDFSNSEVDNLPIDKLAKDIALNIVNSYIKKDALLEFLERYFTLMEQSSFSVPCLNISPETKLEIIEKKDVNLKAIFNKQSSDLLETILSIHGEKEGLTDEVDFACRLHFTLVNTEE